MATKTQDAGSTENIEDLFKQIPEEDVIAKSKMENSGHKTRVPSSCYIPKRYIVTFLTALGMLLTYAMRTNVGVTVVMILDELAHEKVGTLKDMHEVRCVLLCHKHSFSYKSELAQCRWK